MAGIILTTSTPQGVETLQQVLQIGSPIANLLIYLIAFTIRSITTARNDNDIDHEPQQLGPGGKPLPTHNHNIKGAHPKDSLDFSRPRRILFEWLSAGILLSLVGNIIIVLTHALYDRKHEWWCGQAPTVGLAS
jgi:hypothetical protein